MSSVITLTQKGTNQPIKIVKDKIKSFRNVDFTDGSGSARLLTFIDQDQIMVTETLEQIEKLINS